MSDALTGGPCRFCGAVLTRTFADLGMTPLCESFVPADQVNAMEPFYPLHTWVCDQCFLVQLQEYVSREEIFTEYAYFSAYSDAWLAHARRYVETMIAERGLGPDSLVVELASNDGYLLQFFVQADIPVLGIEPAANVAKVAVGERNVPTLVEFFDEHLARRLVAEGTTADLIAGNNVLAQVPDLNTFVAGMKLLLAPRGLITIEFPHLLRLMEENQFDTIYHEHFSYFSLITAERVFAAHGLVIHDVEELWTHGGSLRIHATHAGAEAPAGSERLLELRRRELAAGLERPQTYELFAEQVRETKRKLLEFLIAVKREGAHVVGYGAPGKGNTLLNYCGIGTDFLDYTVDRNPYKHGRFTPGTHIPIHEPSRIAETKPDYVLILPWNLKEEIVAQLHYITEWGGRCVVPIPEATIVDWPQPVGSPR
ncbi:MAG TPA: class I SAM-dependent methyltransferase [Candidatus Ruania gallistercoris]|uniref:Class I SAM-dependent methyltransferase n=1 Tax=Candidatus Ruania gallistercoris TaxID=2838746 RepID=A0A9D2EHI8_9MICO|nr:class I SAM-dependent methyltransferase [Candidatus Ruania gallistercoris]